MVSFSLKNEILTRLQSFCEATKRDSSIELIFGKDSVSIQTEFAASISTYFYNTLISDITINRIDLNDIFQTNFRNESNKSLILQLLSDNTFEVENISDEDILDFFEFGCSIGCSLFMQPLLDQYLKQSENVTNYENEPIANILSIITNKSILQHYSSYNKSFANLSNLSSSNEIDFVSKNLFKLMTNEEFFKWCFEAQNYDLIERIISNENVIVESEDSLLEFILSLSQRNETFLNLLKYVFLEYCSIECISNFITFIKGRIESTEYKQEESVLFISCLSRRCLKLSNGTKLSTLKRHEKTINNITEVSFDSNNPKKGILNHEYLKDNINLKASSNDCPDNQLMKLSDLFVRMYDYTFCTKNEANSSITATIKDNKSFIVNKYMIRGNWCDNNWCQLRSWTVKGQLSSTKEWIELDSHSNENPFNKYEVRTFDIKETEPLCGVQIIQTGPNSYNDNYFGISGFDVFGKIIENNS